jgi:hypothetical protein
MSALLAFDNTNNRYDPLKINSSGLLECAVSSTTITNFPASQTVDCNNTQVAVSNFPASQTVDCNNTQVAVSNFPVTQPISGTVSISGNVNTVGGTPTKASLTLFNATSITAQTTSSSIDVSAYTKVMVVAEGTTAGANTNASTYDVEVSFDNSTFFRSSSQIFPSQNLGATTKRSGHVVVDLCGAKYIKLTTYDTETLTANAFAIQ